MAKIAAIISLAPVYHHQPSISEDSFMNLALKERAFLLAATVSHILIVSGHMVMTFLLVRNAATIGRSEKFVLLKMIRSGVWYAIQILYLH